MYGVCFDVEYVVGECECLIIIDFCYYVWSIVKVFVCCVVFLDLFEVVCLLLLFVFVLLWF